MSVLTDKIMEALDKILPEQPMSFSDNLAFAGGCGCTGNCGRSCSGSHSQGNTAQRPPNGLAPHLLALSLCGIALTHNCNLDCIYCYQEHRMLYHEQ